jgi:hypothetical protein
MGMFKKATERVDLHGWKDGVVKDMWRQCAATVAKIVARATAHQIAVGDRGGVVTGALPDDAERAASQVTAATARECARFAESKADLIDNEHRRLLSEAVAASEASTLAMARLHQFEIDANDFLRAARQPQRPVAAVGDYAVLHADFAHRAERVLNPPQSGATHVAVRTPIEAPSYADLLG